MDTNYETPDLKELGELIDGVTDRLEVLERLWNQQAHDETTPAGGVSALSAGLCVGGRVRLLKSIYDDGNDCYPPGWLAKAGEVLTVKDLYSDGRIAVAHEWATGTFVVGPGEYETPNG